jgi:transcriptional regulator with XRE-family HTH domain
MMQTGKINQRITYFMEQRKMDMEALSQKTGLDIELIDTMLTQDLYPPLGPLMKIARALGVRLGTFLDDQKSCDPYIVRKSERESQFSVPAGKNKPAALNFFALGTGKTDRHMEPFFIEILPDSAKEKILSSHEGEEFIAVIKGSIEIIYGKETQVLNEGDSAYYNSIVPHYVSCVGDDKAKIHAVIYIPE